MPDVVLLFLFEFSFLSLSFTFSGGVSSSNLDSFQWFFLWISNGLFLDCQHAVTCKCLQESLVFPFESWAFSAFCPHALRDFSFESHFCSVVLLSFWVLAPLTDSSSCSYLFSLFEFGCHLAFLHHFIKVNPFNLQFLSKFCPRNCRDVSTVPFTLV